MKTLAYKGFTGSIKYDEESKEYYGRLLNINDYIDYVGAKTIEELEQIFQEAVEDHLADLKPGTKKVKSIS